MAQTLESSQESGDGWLVVGASVIGTSHIADAKPCQDAHCLRLLPGGCLIAAVSDGAGSAEMSDLGSRLAVDTFATVIVQSLQSSLPTTDEEWTVLMRASFEAAAHSMTDEAAKRSVPVRRLSATLLAVVIHPTRSVFANVGDCAAVSSDGTGAWLLPVKPVRGEYANETTFLTGPGWQKALQIEFLQAAPDRLALFSDGLIRLALNLAVPAPHAPFFESVFAFITSRPFTVDALNALRDFLDSERVNARTDDDKTLVLAWRERGCPE